MNDNLPTGTAMASLEAMHLFDKLMETAAGWRRDKVLTDHELIGVFLGVAMTFAEMTQGPKFAVDLARRLAEGEEANATVN